MSSARDERAGSSLQPRNSGKTMRLYLAMTCGLVLLLCSCSGGKGSSNVSSQPGSPSNFDVNVTFSGTGTGAVLSNPSGISCRTGASNRCSMSVPSGTTVKLTVTPDPLMVFGGWSGGGCSGTTLKCSFAVTGNTKIVV